MSCAIESDFPTLNLSMAQGATWRESFGYRADGTPVDITGVGIEMEIKFKADDPFVLRLTNGAQVDAHDGGGITITNGPGGAFEVLITDERTDLLVKDRALYQIRFSWPDGTEDLFLYGTIAIVPNI